MGQVLVQLGVVQKRIVNKFQKQAAQIGKASFALAWVMDEDESERERGVTIDIATKHISTQTHDLTILDAPGHADFVPAMITGAASADVGILVVAATPGEFESGFDDTTGTGSVKGHVGQTREHITLARGLGVSQLIVAVNKLDAAEPSWSQDRFIEIRRRLVPFLKANGFDMKRVQFVPISGLSGINVKTPPSMNESNSAGLASWYKGKETLLQAIDKFEPAKRNIDKPFRFLASDIYSEGKFVIVKGRVVQGLISAGDKVAILPISDGADVGRIEHGIAASGESSGERMNIAMAGDSVELYLTGIDIARISVGNVISDVDENLRPKLRRKMRAKIIVMDRLTVPIIRVSQVLLHMHSLDFPATISGLISQTNRKDGSLQERPRVLTGGANATVEIKLSEKICLETFADCRALGRFALRQGGDTVAVGIVESLK
jgi:elongation factor 1 alpha-like protein